MLAYYEGDNKLSQALMDLFPDIGLCNNKLKTVIKSILETLLLVLIVLQGEG